uniref:Phytocyanin domain-containing protein n=1 Tax=Setaria italica TaxID=4555 RepID=K4A2E0_SETIT
MEGISRCCRQGRTTVGSSWCRRQQRAGTLQFVLSSRMAHGCWSDEVFKYTKGSHSVVEATAAGFAACSEANSLGAWASGDDRVALNTSGRWWFFSGVGKDCVQGMKFNLTVIPAVELSPPSLSPPPLRADGGVAAVLAAAAVVAAALLL